MARMRLPDIAIVGAAMLLAAASAREISVAAAGRDAADDAAAFFVGHVERGHGRFGPTFVTSEGRLGPNRFELVCAPHFKPHRHRHDYRECAVVRSGQGATRVVRVDRFGPSGHYRPLLLRGHR